MQQSCLGAVRKDPNFIYHINPNKQNLEKKFKYFFADGGNSVFFHLYFGMLRHPTSHQAEGSIEKAYILNPALH